MIRFLVVLAFAGFLAVNAVQSVAGVVQHLHAIGTR